MKYWLIFKNPYELLTFFSQFWKLSEIFKNKRNDEFRSFRNKISYHTWEFLYEMIPLIFKSLMKILIFFAILNTFCKIKKN